MYGIQQTAWAEPYDDTEGTVQDYWDLESMDNDFQAPLFSEPDGEPDDYVSKSDSDYFADRAADRYERHLFGDY